MNLSSPLTVLYREYIWLIGEANGKSSTLTIK